MINKILNDIDNKECYYVGINGCLYQDLDKEELLAIKQEIERLKEELEYTIPIVEHNKTITKHLEEIERLTISLQAQEELTMIWYNKVKKIREYIKEWQSFPHTNGSTHKELKNLMEIIDCAGSDKE